MRAVIDRLRWFLNRPLSDADRPRLFAISVALIAATAIVLALLDDAGSAPPPPRRAAVSRPLAPAARPPEAPAPEPVAAAPGEEGDPAQQAPRAEVARSKRAARRFLAGYLPYSYGRATPITAATADLRRRLAREPPRVPARERRRRPRLVLLQSDGVGRRRAHFVALVSDGARRYTLQLELERTAGGWAVADVRA